MLKILFDGVEIDNDTIVSFSQTVKPFAEGKFKVGLTVCRQFDLELMKSDISKIGVDDIGVYFSINETSDDDAIISSDENGVFYTSDETAEAMILGKDYAGIFCSDGSTEVLTIPEKVLIYDDEDLYATLYVDSYDENDLRSVSFTLTDGMILLNKNYDFSAISPASAQSVLNALCSNVLGCQNVAIAYGGDINLNYSSDVMARDIVSWIAEINGCYARVDASGQLELIRFSNDNPASIDINMCADFRLGEYHRIERVYCELATATRYYPTDYTGEYDTLYLNPLNELITDSGSYTVAQTVEHVYSLISGFEFYSLVSSRCVINQSSWPGDPLQFVLGNVSYPTITQIDWEDLDKDSYRSVVNGDLIRNVLKRRWSKIALTFKGVSDSECQTLLSSVNRETVYFKMRSPAFGTNNFITFKGYVSKMSAKTSLLKRGWDVSFNIVQEKGASWQ